MRRADGRAGDVKFVAPPPAEIETRVVNPPLIARSLNPHAPFHRRPAVVLRRLLDLVDEDTHPDAVMGMLEQRVATLLGTEAALFFPTGTMVQQVALRIHAERTGRRTFAAHPHVHLDNHEERGYAAVHGLRLRTLGDRNELLTTAALVAVGEPLGAVVWELPQRELGGLLPEWHDLVEQVATVRAAGAATHLDGARLWEAQPFYDRPLAEIAGLFDTVYVSLYKGLRGVRGAVLAAGAPTIAEASVWRTRLGGAIPDAWPLALAGLDGLDQQLPRMAEYRDHAVAMAKAITADGSARVVPDPPQTPMFHVHLPCSREAVQSAVGTLLEEQGVQFPRYVFTVSPDPQVCGVELTVGEPTLDFTPDEVARLVRELVRLARR